MIPRENLIQLYHPNGYTNVAVGFILCVILKEEYRKRYPEAKCCEDQFNFPYQIITDPDLFWNFINDSIINKSELDKILFGN